MYVRVWEYDVAPDRVDDFRATYGADGAWARLFARSEGYLGTELRAVADVALRFRTIDRFRAEADWFAFLAEFRAKYDELDAECEQLTVCEREISAGDEPSGSVAAAQA